MNGKTFLTIFDNQKGKIWEKYFCGKLFEDRGICIS